MVSPMVVSPIVIIALLHTSPYMFYLPHGPSLLQCVDDDPLIAKIHAHAEVFSPKVEFVFSYLQVGVGRKSEGGVTL